MKLHKKMVDRMKAEGTMKQYMRLRRFFELYRDEKGVAIEKNLITYIASAAFPPLDGSQPEFFNDPIYAEILSNWKNHKYPTPPDFELFASGIPNHAKFKEEPSEELKAAAEEIAKAPKKVEQTWQNLAAKVGDRQADALTASQWVFDNYMADISKINPETVPSLGALGLLQYVKSGPSNYGDFVRTIYSKLLPSKSEMEYATRFKDDGRDLTRLADFLRIENGQAEDVA